MQTVLMAGNLSVPVLRLHVVGEGLGVLVGLVVVAVWEQISVSNNLLNAVASDNLRSWAWGSSSGPM